MRCKVLAIFFSAWLFAISGYAADKWDKTDIGLGMAAVTLKIADWGQTRYAVTHEYREENPILGDSPSKSQVDLYFAGSALVQFAVAHYLPSDWRKIWLIGWIGLSGYNIHHNYSAGIGFRF